MSHTPAPWRLWLSEDDRGAFVLHGDSPAPHGKGMVIAQRNIGTPDGNEGIANARLIAAAPTMLAALKKLIEKHIILDDCGEDVRAAIAAAEGK